VRVFCKFYITRIHLPVPAPSANPEFHPSKEEKAIAIVLQFHLPKKRQNGNHSVDLLPGYAILSVSNILAG
jgi:hypothetical protein